MSDKPGKPLIFADAPFDEERQDYIEFANQKWDPAYVPGYSEKRRQNHAGALDGVDPVPLPRLAWVRISTTAGGDVKPSDQQMINWRQLGYRAVGTDLLQEMAEQYWPEYGYSLPPTAQVAADGTIRRDDTALFMVPAALADRNREREITRKKNQGPRMTLESEDGLELYQDKRVEQKGVTPREAWQSAIPEL